MNAMDHKIIADLILENKMSPVTKLGTILRSINKKKVEYKLANSKYTQFGLLYIIEASNGELIATGRGLRISTAKTNAALILLNQIFNNVYKCISTPSTSDVNIQLPTLNQNQAETVFHNNEFTTLAVHNSCNTNNQVGHDHGKLIHFNKDGNNTSCTTQFTHNSYDLPTLENESIAEENLILQKKNYIGLVQEFCMAHNFQLPVYNFVQSEDNSLIFTVICSLLTFDTLGKGKSKQLAKRNSACEMYKIIRQLSKIQIDKLKNNYNSSKVHSMPAKSLNAYLSPNSMHRLEVFLKQLCLSNKKDAVLFLDSIAKDEKFTLEYNTISNESENCTVMVKLSTDPVIVCLGTGKTVIDAKYSAAYTILVLLQHPVTPSD